MTSTYRVESGDMRVDVEAESHEEAAEKAVHEHFKDEVRLAWLMRIKRKGEASRYWDTKTVLNRAGIESEERTP